MRRLLLLIVTLSLATLAFAHQSSRGQANNDFYNQVLSAQVDRFQVENDAISPSATEISEPQNASSELPASMASEQGAQSADWYGQKVAIQAELNRRAKKAQVQNTF